MLARAGVPVTLIGRAAHVAAVARDGLLIEGLRVNERIPVAATESTESGVRGADLILFCVKSGDTESAAREMQPWLKPGACILSFQNGVDNPDRIHDAIQLHPIPTAVYVAAEMTAPGRVTHTGRGDLVVGYRAGWPHQPDLEPIAAMFRHAEVPCEISPDIAAELWGKMVVNCAFNAVSALTRAKYGRMFASEPVRTLCMRALAEAVDVGRAEGVSIAAEAAEQAALRISESMAGATSSMAQDIARGRRTEIDSLNGYIARRGKALGVPTPVSEQLTAMIRLLEDAVLATRSTN
jgi:2-dehydropantoate 2-reductase